MNMKKLLLTALVLLTTVVGRAQTDPYGSAFEMKSGENTWTFDSESDIKDMYWKYTAPESGNSLLLIKSINNCQVACIEITKDSSTGEDTTVTLTNASYAYEDYTYASAYGIEAGKTVYLKVSGYTTKIGFSADIKSLPNYGKGRDASNPMPLITDGETLQMLGNPYQAGYGTQTSYASCAADKDGVLVITCGDYVGDCTIGGTSYPFARNYNTYKYEAKVPVTAGDANNISITSYNPFVFTAMLTYPSAGSADKPFTAVTGDNVLPKDKGVYYYTYTNEKAGFVTVSGGNAADGSKVEVYESRSSLDQYVYESSEQNSYNVRFEAQREGNTFYIKVTKGGATETDEIISISEEEYKAGDVEANPIVLSSLPEEVTVAAQQTVYYSTNIEAGKNCFLRVKANTKVESYNTMIMAYQKGNSYSGSSDKEDLRMSVSGGNNGQDYIIKITSNETNPLTFTVSTEDVKDGDLITKPLTAVLGENTIDGSGTKYYKYTATKDCRLTVTVASESTLVSFPKGTEYYDGYYDVTKKGLDYCIEATEGTDYLITLSNVADGEKFNVSEGEWGAGESRATAIEAEDGVYTLGSEAVNGLWIKYVSDKEGMLSLNFDADYNYSYTVKYAKNNDELKSFFKYVTEDGSYNTLYSVDVATEEGDVFYAYLKLGVALPDKVVTFAVRDYAEGETVDKAISLEKEKTVTVPAANSGNAVWCKMTLKKGSVRMELNNYISGYIYSNIDDAKAKTNGTYVYAVNESPKGSTETIYSLKYDVTDDKDGVYYLCVEYSSMDVDITISGDGVVDTATSIGENIKEASKKPVAYYSIDGHKLDAPVKGLNIVRLQNGKTMKVVIR